MEQFPIIKTESNALELILYGKFNVNYLTKIILNPIFLKLQTFTDKSSNAPENVSYMYQHYPSLLCRIIYPLKP